MEKIIPFDKVSKFFGKKLDKKTVLIGGCFDILHLGHIRFLKQAKKLGDILIILLESDEKIKKIKGEGRPVNTQAVRAEMLSALEDVNFIILLPKDMENKDYDLLVSRIKPDFIAVTKGDSGLENKKRSAKLVNAKIIIATNLIEGYSTSKILS